MRTPGADESPALNGSPEPPTTRALVPLGAPPRPVAPLPPPAALSAAPNLVGLLLALRRRWLLALSLALLCGAVAAVAVWFLRPVTFTARTLLHIKSYEEPLIFPIQEGRPDFSNYQRVQVALVKSRLVLNSALRDPKVE